MIARDSMHALVECPRGALLVPARAAREPGEPISLRLSLVIPTINERRTLVALIAQLTDLLDPALGAEYELIVVDDDSPDRTWELATELSITYPRLRVIRRQGERGLSTAVVRGWQVACGEVLAVIDGDLQHPPEVVLALWREMATQADLVVASRHVEAGGVSDWNLFRRTVSRGAQLVGLLLLPGVLGRVSDPMSGYFMVRRNAIAEVELSPLGYKILIEVIARGRVRFIAEVGYVFRERSEGQSKVSWKIYTAYLHHLLRLRLTTLPGSRFFRFAIVGVSAVLATWPA